MSTPRRGWRPECECGGAVVAYFLGDWQCARCIRLAKERKAMEKPARYNPKTEAEHNLRRLAYLSEPYRIV